MPKGFDRIIGSLVIAVPGEDDDEKYEVDPTKGVHKSFCFLGCNVCQTSISFGPNPRMSYCFKDRPTTQTT